MKCEYLGIDIQDDMGRHEVGFVENTVKTPIGNDEEGCLFEARFHINKVREAENNNNNRELSNHVYKVYIDILS